MASAIEKSSSFHASGELALHVLDTMQTILEASHEKRELKVKNRYEGELKFDFEFTL